MKSVRNRAVPPDESSHLSSPSFSSSRRHRLCRFFFLLVPFISCLQSAAQCTWVETIFRSVCVCRKRGRGVEKGRETQTTRQSVHAGNASGKRYGTTRARPLHGMSGACACTTLIRTSVLQRPPLALHSPHPPATRVLARTLPAQAVCT